MSASYAAVPNPKDSTRLGRSYGELNSGVSDYAQGNPVESSPLAQSLGHQSQFTEDIDDSVQSSTADDSAVKRSASSASTAVHNSLPSRGGTLKKKGSVRRTGSLKRSSSRRSLKAGSIKGLGFDEDQHDSESIFYTPIPTSGSPTEILADRFQAWRQLLKSLIAYFREVQGSYEIRSKALTKLQNTAANITSPTVFATHNGLGEATRILDDYHKHSVTEANKSRDIEGDVIGALTGLRADLAQKIKEIKNLSGDFKNSVEKEKDTTRREIEKLRSAIEQSEHDAGSSGKNDPFVVRLGVDRAVEKQIDEENYLHRAYLNLESSGRELESIVVGEIQKAYKALAGILKREGDDSYSVVEDLRSGPIAMPRDQEWSQFVSHDPHFVSPDIPLRRIEDISYPGKNHPAAAEIRAGMLERKSKYLKSYTPGWYVLSPTHLHEFKSADKIYSQPPVMSLFLGDQRLGSHSESGSSSHKFMLKGKQSGGMHKGHNWVFRAESHDTMLAWFNDIKTLTEGSGAEKSAFVQRHTRSVSNASDRRKSMSSDGFADDDADAVPYSADVASLSEQYPSETRPQRPLPGGRFPSDIQIPRVTPLSPSSDDSVRDLSAGALYGQSPVETYKRNGTNPYQLDGVSTGSRTVSDATYDTIDDRSVEKSRPIEQAPVLAAPAAVKTPAKTTQPTRQEPESAAPKGDSAGTAAPAQAIQPKEQVMDHGAPTAVNSGAAPSTQPVPDLAAPVAVSAGVAAGVVGAEMFESDKSNNKELEKQEVMEEGRAVETGTSIPAQEIDTAKMLVTDTDSNAVQATTVPATIPPPLAAADPAATMVPATKSATVEALEAVPKTSLGPRTVSTEAVKSAPMAIRQESSPGLGGLERAGAHETGKLFPTVIRHDTDLSVSKLHVPGEFPKQS